MNFNWLFSTPPPGSYDEQRAHIRAAVAADPTAAAIGDDEAETFMCAAFLLGSYRPSGAVNLFRAVGIPPALHGPRSFRRAVLMTLRRWRDDRVRNLLTSLIPNVGIGRFPDVAEQGEYWTEEAFVEAYESGLNLVWLVRVKRYLGAPDDWEEWLDSISPWAPDHYRALLDVGRLTMRRLVYPDRLRHWPAQQAAAALQPELVESLREKDRISGSLRQGVRQAEQTRKALRRQLKRREQESRELLAQARGEVNAARRALADRCKAQERELQEQARQFEGRLAALREQLAAERRAFVERLAGLPRVDVLGGRPVWVEADAGLDPEACRLLVESLGGRLAADGPAVTLSGQGGFVGLERQLRDLALQQVQIRSDGLCRRKEGRPAIAASGFVARLGAGATLELGSVTCCGPAASSLMAEFGALAMALAWLVRAGAPRGARVEIWSDCRVMLSRLRQPQACRWTRGCVTLDRRVRSLLWQLDRRGVSVTLKWVPRDEVDAADRLCDRTYRAAAWYHRRGGSYKAPLKAFLRETVAR
jgi:ribonuclease HI